MPNQTSGEETSAARVSGSGGAAGRTWLSIIQAPPGAKAAVARSRTVRYADSIRVNAVRCSSATAAAGFTGFTGSVPAGGISARRSRANTRIRS